MIKINELVFMIIRFRSLNKDNHSMIACKTDLIQDYLSSEQIFRLAFASVMQMYMPFRNKRHVHKSM